MYLTYSPGNNVGNSHFVWRVAVEGYHDFSKFSIVPSVSLLVDILERIEDPWYRGQVFVGYKDAAFEPSSALRHAAELSKTMLSNEVNKCSVFVY